MKRPPASAKTILSKSPVLDEKREIEFSGYVLIYLAVYFPNATWMKVLSFIPFWTPTLMLVRLALSTVYWWDIALTIALMLVTICVCAWFSVRMYRFGVLMYGQKPGLGQQVKMVRMK